MDIDGIETDPSLINPTKWRSLRRCLAVGPLIRHHGYLDMVWVLEKYALKFVRLTVSVKLRETCIKRAIDCFQRGALTDIHPITVISVGSKIWSNICEYWLIELSYSSKLLIFLLLMTKWTYLSYVWFKINI